MDNPTPTLTTDDRLAIHELIALHGHIADERAFSRLPELFTLDAIYDLSDFGAGVYGGLEAITGLFANAGERNPLAHHATNVLVEVDAEGTVRVASKGLGVMADGKVGSVVYRDEVVKTPEGWRIAHRVVLRRRPASISEG